MEFRQMLCLRQGTQVVTGQIELSQNKLKCVIPKKHTHNELKNYYEL